MQVAFVHDIIVDDTYRTNTGGGEISQHGTAQPSCANDDHPSRLYLSLTNVADFREEYLPAKSFRHFN
ncbi:hypothetical protein WL22_21435 [Burkholderia ubonensis]|uniref:Uncharacterized protein n=2 Tax=Burkholderia cepacia complex TaxID=87882 RepID=A0AAW3MND1_9BURK|nr:hypothetical protein WT26_27820 [Burkholderia cepacia]AOK26451.1 hypothetical protein WK67_27715 [Burkholderia ubonensis]KVH71576.1 hypothetical protein WJ41_14475 [Burkholderia ubonensis]KVL22436.1 hypothetical protein WJ45_26275 [Burkholderia ubonensis]KVN85714.1 hypothetical protein WJ67_31255 [Burkholderia ubonensis]